MSLPHFIPPMLAISGSFITSDSYLYEPKWDGLRCLAFMEERVRLMSRNGRDMTAHFPELKDIHCLEGKPWVADAELVIFKNGKADFDMARDRNLVSTTVRSMEMAQQHPASLILFDLLYHRGGNVMTEPLSMRRRRLEDHTVPGPRAMLSPGVIGAGPDFHATVIEHGCEGTMMKHVGSPYTPGKRSAYWVKIRDVKETDCLIGGFILRKRQLTSLLLGQYHPAHGHLHYIGRVGTGFSEQQKRVFLHFLTRIEVTDAPFSHFPSDTPEPRWVKPLTVCRIEYLMWTPGGVLRHPVFRGIRTDKRPLECSLAPYHPDTEGTHGN